MKKNFRPKGPNSVSKLGFFHFLKFGSLILLEIACSDSLQQCLTCSRAKIHEKKFWCPNLGQRGQNLSRNQVFCHFLKFGSLVFLEIAYNDKIHQKNFWGPNLVQKSQNRPQNQVFYHFLNFSSLVFFEIAYNYSLRQCLTTIRGKTHQKVWGEHKFGSDRPKLDPKLSFLPFSQVWCISFLLNYIR